MSVAEDVYVVAGIDIEDGKAGKVAYGAMFGYTGYPFDNIEVARVGGDADEESAALLCRAVANDGFGE